jgi:hypothetical protein
MPISEKKKRLSILKILRQNLRVRMNPVWRSKNNYGETIMNSEHITLWKSTRQLSNTRGARTAIRTMGLATLMAATAVASVQANDPVLNLNETGRSSWSTNYYSPCSNELIYFEIDETWSVAEAFVDARNRSSYHSIFNIELHGVGVGYDTGNEYVVSETFHRVWNNNSNHTDGPVNLGERDHFQAVAKGDDDNVVFHFAYFCATTPAADYWFDCQVEIDSVSFQCRG